MMITVPMTGAHVSQIAEIEQASFKTPWSRQMIENELKNPFAHYFVVQNSDEVVAYMGFYIILDEAHITNVAVKEAYRGQGIADRLVTTVLSEMRKLGAVRATLEVNENNYKAIKLYEKYGFVLSGRRPKYYEGVDAALIYWLEL